MDTRSARPAVNGQRSRETSGVLLERLDAKELAALERGRKLSLS
jgi:hypothetical protein